MPRTTTRLIKGREVWKTITSLVKGSQRNLAAVAYLGRDAGGLLPLKEGDTLVVDMSLGAVKQGVTDPREVEKYLERGVHVASRSNLHAKVVVAGNWLIAGSMNISRNSAEVLAEAAILTNGRGATRAARTTIERWARSPVLPLQLAAALKAYRPPVFKAAKTIRRPRPRGRPAGTGPSLWVVAGLRALAIPAKEQELADQAAAAATEGRRHHRGTHRDWIRFLHRNRLVDEVRPDDWVICVVDGEVEAPSLVASKTTYSRGKGRHRYLVVIEERDTEAESWPRFRRAAARAAGKVLPRRERFRAFHDPDTVEALLGCWSPKTWMPLKKYFAPHRRNS